MPSIKAMLRGEQYFDHLQGHPRSRQGHGGHGRCRAAGKKEVAVNDTKTYNNGVKVVPSYLLKPVVVDKTNWEKVLIDSGYYRALGESRARRVSWTPRAPSAGLDAADNDRDDGNAGDARRQQELCRRAGVARRQFDRRGRPDPCAGRRERRRQVDPDEGAERGLSRRQL